MAKKEKVKEVIVPKWIAWVNLFLMLLIISLILYINQIVPPQEKLDPLALVLLILVLLIVIFITFLSAYKKLPMYLLRELA